MTLEKRRPLPAGRYWIDVFPQHRPKWDAYVAVMAQRGSLGVETTQYFEPVDGAPEHTFVIFRTKEELVWPDDEMGFAPNVAGPEIQSSDDTVQKPDPAPDPLKQLNDWGNAFSKVLGVVVGVSLVAAAVVVVTTVAKKRKR